MSASTYWGPFAAVREMETLQLTETGAYEGISAQLMSDFVDTSLDVADYIALAADCNEVLELACGSGRVLLGLARHGRRVVGVDIAGDMLDVLRRRLSGLPGDAQARVELLQADATRVRLGRRFPLVLLPGSSILLFAGDQRVAILRTAAAHLAPDGTFVFDYFTFRSQAVSAFDERVISARVPSIADASAFLGLKFTPDGGRILINSYCQIPGEDGRIDHHLDAKELVLIDDDELDSLFDRSGLVRTKVATEPLPGGIGERRVVHAARRSGRRYPLWHPYQPMDAVAENVLMLSSGHGCRVRTADGTELIDASGGLWSTQCGLGDPDIIAAIEGQLKQLSYGTLFAGRGNKPALALARELVQLAPAPLEHVYLTGSGSESVELAIKLVRRYATLAGHEDRRLVAYLDESYHGTFFGSMGVTGLYADKNSFAPLLPGLLPVSTPSPSRCPAGLSYEGFALDCAAELERRLGQAGGQVAALIIEPVLGSAGVVVPPKEYLRAVQRACRKHGALLVLDEVATGFGRTGRWFAAEHFDLRPDVLLLSKGITSGYLPLGAVLFSAEIGAALIEHGVGLGHGSSHNGNPACCAAARAAIAVIRRDRLVERAAAIGAYFRTRLEELRRHACVRDVRSLGLMLGVDLRAGAFDVAMPEAVSSLYLGLQRRGVLAYPAPAGLVFLPALVITREEVDAIVDALHDTLRGMART